MNVEDSVRAREIVLRHGWNTTSYQILNPGMSLWFANGREGVVGYVQKHHTRVVAGAPVCALNDIANVVSEWEGFCEAEGFSPCYFGAEQRLSSYLFGRAGYCHIVVGAQPIWKPDDFLTSMATVPSLRYQLSRARSKGVSVHEWEPVSAAGNSELKACLDEWLATRGLPPLHFLVEPYTLDDLMDRRLFVATLGDRPVGFVVLTPVPSRQGWLTEQFVHGASAPNGTIELTLYEAVRNACASTDRFVTMGIVPLSGHSGPADQANPLWLRLLLGWARAHGRRFYNFDGLDRFKSKFRPSSWEPMHVIARGPRFTPSLLYSVVAAFCEPSPMAAALRGVSRACRQEVESLQRAFPEPLNSRITERREQGTC